MNAVSAIFNQFQQCLASTRPQFVKRRSNGRQRRIAEGGLLQIVAPDDAEINRNASTGMHQRVDGADSHLIVSAEERGHARVSLEYLKGCFRTAFLEKTSVCDS